MNIWIVGVIIMIVGLIVIAIPFAAWTDGAVGDRLPDIAGTIAFAIGLIFIIIWAIKYAQGHIK